MANHAFSIACQRGVSHTHDFFELNLRLLSRTGVQPESTTVIANAFPLLGELMGVYVGQGRDSIR